MIQEFSNKITCNMLSSLRSYVKDFHIHNFYELFLLLEGEIDFCVQQTFYHLTPGALMIMNDSEVHKAINKGKTAYKRIYIHIPPSFFEKYQTADINLAGCFTERKNGEHNMIQLDDQQVGFFKEKQKLIEQNEKNLLPGKELLLETYILQLLVFVNQQFGKTNSRQSFQYTPTIQSMVDYMEDNLLSRISLDSLAKQFSISKYYLCHIFKEETGTTIFSYLQTLRIAKAKLLLRTGKNVSEACDLAGFTNYSNFITTFKSYTGYTPKKYAEEVRG